MREPLRVTLRLPPEPDSVPIARGVVRTMAAGFAPVVVERAELALSELVTNAIRHGTDRSGNGVDVELTLVDDGVFGVVRDSGPPFRLPTSAPQPNGVGGFGLYIVQRVSDLHIDHTGGGNAVTFAVVDRPAATLRCGGPRGGVGRKTMTWPGGSSCGSAGGR